MIAPAWKGDDAFNKTLTVELERACKLKFSISGGITLFPGYQSEYFIGGNEIRLTAEHFLDLNGVQVITPALVGCVDYRIGGLPRHHQTRFAYRLFQNNAPMGGQFFRMGVFVPPQDLTFARDQTRDDAN